MGHGAGQTALPKRCGWITRRGPVDTGGRPRSGSARWKTGAEPKKNGFPPDNQEPRHWRSKPEPGGVSPGESADGLTHP